MEERRSGLLVVDSMKFYGRQSELTANVLGHTAVFDSYFLSRSGRALMSWSGPRILAVPMCDARRRQAQSTNVPGSSTSKRSASAYPMRKCALHPDLPFDAANAADSRAAGVYRVAIRSAAKAPRSFFLLPHRRMFWSRYLLPACIHMRNGA